MRRGPTAWIRLAFLVLALRGLLGADCGVSDNQAWVEVVPDASSVETLSVFMVEVSVTSFTPIQAFEVGLQWDPEMLYPINVAPHPEFDDDGTFFTEPHFDRLAGTLARVVDLRHGGEGALATFRIATVEFLSLGIAGPVSIEVTSRGLAKPDGSKPVVTVVPATITVGP